MAMLNTCDTLDHGPRWRVVPYSQSGHCCFEATVVDTTKPEMIGGERYIGPEGYIHYDPICETYSVAEAVQIANALNAKEPT